MSSLKYCLKLLDKEFVSVVREVRRVTVDTNLNIIAMRDGTDAAGNACNTWYQIE